MHNYYPLFTNRKVKDSKVTEGDRTQVSLWRSSEARPDPMSKLCPFSGRLLAEQSGMGSLAMDQMAPWAQKARETEHRDSLLCGCLAMFQL